GDSLRARQWAGLHFYLIEFAWTLRFCPCSMRSLFYAGDDDSLHKLALREEEQHCGQGDSNDGSCHRPAGESSKRAEEIANAHRKWKQLIFANQIYQRVEVIVPTVEKVKERYGSESRDRLGKDHRPQGSERPCAINHSRFVQLFGHTHKILAKQKHVVGIGK